MIEYIAQVKQLKTKSCKDGSIMYHIVLETDDVNAVHLIKQQGNKYTKFKAEPMTQDAYDEWSVGLNEEGL